MNDRLRAAPVGVIETTRGGTVTDVNEPAVAAIGADRDDVDGVDIREAFPKSAAGTLRDAFEGEEPTETSFEEYYPRIERWLAVDVRVGDTVLVYVRDRTDHRETERTVDRLEQRLERVQQIDGLIVAVLQQLVSAADRVEVAETVCARLGGTDPYTFAWVGDRDFPADRLRVLAAAGDAPELRDRIEDCLDGDGTLPEQAAVTAGESRLVGAIADDESVPRDVRRAAFGHGLQSCLAVPLVYQGTVHGVVSVYSREEAGFSEQERAGLETLGRIAGFAVHAIRREDLLVSDTVTEVTVEVRDGDLPFVDAAREGNTALSLDGAVPRGDGSVVCYLGTDDPNEGVAEALSARDDIADVRWIRDGSDPLLQVTVDGETPVTVLGAWGATVSSAEYTSDSARLVAETSSDEDVRRMVEAVDDTVAETSLLAKEQLTRDHESVEAFRNALAERLTDKQRRVLRTAMLSEYFESPRGSSAEEVAESLDITGPTLLYHLRRAQRKLVAAFFETDPGVAPADSG
jgi:GAF domain-containing protein/DNA-binding CsgD family transcriptional regulator